MTCCLFANMHRLWISVAVPSASQPGHFIGGSFTRPRSTYVISGGDAPHDEHLKNAIFKSGMMALHRVTIPRTATSLSMSLGFKSRIGFVSCKLYVLTWNLWNSSSSPSGKMRSTKCSLATTSKMGIISCGYATSSLYRCGSYACRCLQSRSSWKSSFSKHSRSFAS